MFSSPIRQCVQWSFLRGSKKFWYDWMASDKKKFNRSKSVLLSQNKSSISWGRKQVNQLSGYHEISQGITKTKKVIHISKNKIILWHCFSNIAWQRIIVKELDNNVSLLVPASRDFDSVGLVWNTGKFPHYHNLRWLFSTLN